MNGFRRWFVPTEYHGWDLLIEGLVGESQEESRSLWTRVAPGVSQMESYREQEAVLQFRYVVHHPSLPTPQVLVIPHLDTG